MTPLLIRLLGFAVVFTLFCGCALTRDRFRPMPTQGQTREQGLVYLWAVRARFELDGQPRVTQWSVLTAKGRNQLLPEQRAGTLPSLGYYPFKTPVEPPEAPGLEPRPGPRGPSG